MDKTLTAALVIRAENASALRGIREVQSSLGSLRSGAKRAAEGLAAIGAGAAVGEFVRSSVSAAISSQAESARVSTALINDGAAATKNLAEVQKFAIDTSSKLAITQEGLKEAYVMSRFSGLDNADAITASTAAAKLAIGTTRDVASAQAQAVDTSRMLSTSFTLFGDKLKPHAAQIAAIADSYAKLQMSANFKDQGELNEALTQSLNTSKTYGLSLAVQNAILQQLTAHGKFSSEAGTSFVELVSKLGPANKKMLAFMRPDAQGHLDVVATIGAVVAATRGMGDVQKGTWLAQHGFEMRSVQGITAVLDGYDQLKASIKDYGAAATGANEALFQKRSGAADEQIAVAANNYRNFQEALGTTLIPTLTKAIRAASELFGVLRGFAEAHPIIAEVALGFLGVSAAIAAMQGVLTILGVGKTLTYAWSAATKIATAAQWLFNAALDANPIAIAIIGVAALAAGAYELYQHWEAVKALFKTWGAEVLGYLKWPFVALPAEIMKAAGAVEDAATSIAHRIARLFVGHSPIPEGPLHDLNLSRQVAISLRPEPVISATRRLAAAAALTIPIALTTPAFAAPRLATVAPGLAAARMPALSMSRPGRAESGGAPITLNLNSTVHVHGSEAGTDAEVVRAAVREELRRSGHELAETLRREQQKRARLEF